MEQKIFERDCLFAVWIFLSHSKIFLLILSDHRNITGEGIQNDTFTRYSTPLSSEDFLRCHTYCDTGQPFKMVISELTPVAECFAVFAVLSLPVLITTYVCPERGSNRDLPRAKQTLYHWTTAADGTKSNKQTWFLKKQGLPSAKRKNLISGTQ